jgi:hypothetical protein
MAWSEFKNNTIRVAMGNVGDVANSAGRFTVKLDAQQCPPEGCPPIPVPDIGTPMLWSDRLSWQSDALPLANSRVTIDANMWIVMDISPPALKSLTIYGKLSFYSNTSDPRSLHLLTRDITLYGFMEILGEQWTDEQNGTHVEPYVGNASVTLYGEY